MFPLCLIPHFQIPSHPGLGPVLHSSEGIPQLTGPYLKWKWNNFLTSLLSPLYSCPYFFLETGCWDSSHHVLFQIITSTQIEGLQLIAAKNIHSPTTRPTWFLTTLSAFRSCPWTLGPQQMFYYFQPDFPNAHHMATWLHTHVLSCCQTCLCSCRAHLLRPPIGKQATVVRQVTWESNLGVNLDTIV